MDWETAPEKPLSKIEQGMKDSMGLVDGYAGPAEDPSKNLAMLEEELKRPNLHPVARKALEEEHAKMSGQSANMKWEDAPTDAKWEDAPAKPASTYKSGTMFENVREMLPEMPTWDRIKGGWNALTEDFTKANAETDKIRAINQKPASQRTAAEKKTVEEFDTRRMKAFKDMAKQEHAAGAGVLDIAGGLPAMVAGGARGVYSGIKNKDATKGLQDAGDTMSNLLPSNLLPGYDKEDQNNEGYHAAMAPITAIMDTFNAVPTLAGEGLNAAGYDKAATQVQDAGKLGIMAGLGAFGARELIKGSKPSAITDPAAKLEALRREPMPEPEPLQPLETTAAHADDFAAINPYDQGGHVTKAQEGRPTTIDQAQGDLFGSENLQEAMPGPDMGQASIRHESLPYEPASMLALEPKVDGPTRLQEMGQELNQFDRPYGQGELGLEPMVRTDTPMPQMNQARMHESAIEANHAALEAPAKLENPVMHEAMKTAEREAAFKEAEAVSKAQKEAHYRALEDVAVATRAGELDFQHARDVVGDKSLMAQDKTITMRGQLRRGDIEGALKNISENHPNVAYRELATYLSGKLEGVKIKMHDEPIVKLGEREVTGYYDADNHVVGLSGLGATSPHTILHELGHSITSRFINDHPMDIRVRGLNSLFDLVDKDGAMGKRFPGIVNAKEFIAEAWSNPKFQEFLKSKTIDGRNMWNKFVDSIKAIVGLPPNSKLSNAFEHAMDLGKQIAEAQTGKQEALSQFKKAGVPNKLADLMAQKPSDTPIETRVAGGMEQVAKRIPGLESPISDFAFYDKPMPEIIEMAKNSPDIPDTLMEKFAQQMQGGALFESLKTRNPVVKQTYERITRAFQEAERNVKTYLTNPETGLKKYMRDLTPTEKGEIHAAMMMVEGQKELSSMDLASAGFNEKQIAYAMKHRELDNQFFEKINERRAAAGLAPMDKRVAHIAGRFLGDFARMVTDAEGKIVGRISGSTTWELDRATKVMKEQHPEWTYGKQEYNKIGHGKSATDRFAGMMEAINFLGKTDRNVAAFMDSYKGYLQQDAVNYLNATRHAKAKVKEAGGIMGSEGNKPWLSAVKNAEEGMKAQLAYYEQGYQWMAMEKATHDLKELLGNEEVIQTNPNAVKYSDQYVKHAMGRDQGPLANGANWTASMLGELLGIGHSNLLKGSNTLKHLIMQKFMGLMNIPFTLTQLSQPLQTQPAIIRLMRNRGLEFSTMDAQVKATETYLHNALEHHGLSSGKLSQFERDAVKYADEMSIFDVKMSDHTKDINASALKEGYDKLADLNIEIPEKVTRGMTFLFYSHMLKDAGMPVKDIFGAAENMTNMTMVNYRPIERPMGYAKLGWLGDVASTLTRYKHNQWSQLAFYAREAKKGGGVTPLATFLGTSLAFGGAMGFFAYQEADQAYSWLAEHVFKKPDSITNQLLKSDLPEVVTHGMFSTLGLDMTSRFSNANAVPDSVGAALMPHGSAVLDIMQNTGRYVMDPTNMYKGKQAVKSIAPQSVQGLLENHMFSTETKNGNKLYQTATDGPNLGKGRVERDSGDQTLRNFGFRGVRESKELAKNFSDSQMAKGHKNIAEAQITKAQYAALDDSLTPAKYRELVQNAADHGMDPNTFMSKMVSWSMDRKLTQKQQQLLRNANGGFKGAFNIKENSR